MTEKKRSGRHSVTALILIDLTKRKKKNPYSPYVRVTLQRHIGYRQHSMVRVRSVIVWMRQTGSPL